MVSYEVSIGFIIITVLLAGRFAEPHHHRRQPAGGIWMWHGFRMFNFAEFPNNILVGVVMIAMLGMFFISALAETNRPPFDLPEAESELVAGYQVEYSSTPYLLFMIGEYLNIVMMCAMTTILFLGGWHCRGDRSRASASIRSSRARSRCSSST
jgi:NADH-quinone oxidoreductase subunit H